MSVLGKVFFDVLMFQVYLVFKDHKFKGVWTGHLGILKGEYQYAQFIVCV